MSATYTVDITNDLIRSGFVLPSRLRIVGVVGQSRKNYENDVTRFLVEDYDAPFRKYDGKHCVLGFTVSADRGVKLSSVEVVEDA